MEGQSSKSEMYSARLNDHEIYQCRKLNLNIIVKTVRNFQTQKHLFSDMAMDFYLLSKIIVFIYIHFFQVLNIKIAKSLKCVCILFNMTYSNIFVLFSKSHKVLFKF